AVRPDSAWMEEALWLHGPSAFDAAGVRPTFARASEAAQFPEGGYYFLGSDRHWLMLRCPNRFRHRPAHADLLHVDVWWKGMNLIQDPGTYSYNSQGHWNNGLVHTQVHSTVGVDGEDQMRHHSKFLFLRWARGSVWPMSGVPDGVIEGWEAVHDGYARLDDPVRHCRRVQRLPGDHWIVLDWLTSREIHQYRLHWLLLDVPYALSPDPGVAAGCQFKLVLQTPAGEYSLSTGGTEALRCNVVRADPTSTRGWVSRRYAHKDPALSVEAECRSQSVCLWTILGPGTVEISYQKGALLLRGNAWQREVAVAEPSRNGSR
ncbi:MAG: hypothetical protein FJ404_19325, partial [Verrucomicrobia bacterium]|nr:hypothetical protein [Verrucomicrobiota bacterium]